jgi:hypothetical protein
LFIEQSVSLSAFLRCHFLWKWYRLADNFRRKRNREDTDRDGHGTQSFDNNTTINDTLSQGRIGFLLQVEEQTPHLRAVGLASEVFEFCEDKLLNSRCLA